MAPMDAEKRLERVMDRLWDHRSASHPATSTAGRSVSLLHTTVGSVNRERSGTQLQGGYRSRPCLVSTTSGSVPLCRPWDRGDLFRRLATFKSMSWFGKPQVVDPVSCARRGWVNVDIDMIACDACGAHQSFPIPPSWSKQQVESAAEEFATKLESGHKSLCPWKGNYCVEGLADFPPTSHDVLVQEYKDRCEALLRLSALPAIAATAIEQMKLSKRTQLDSLLSRLPGIDAPYVSGKWDNEAGAECIKELYEEDNSYHQARKLISLCGWELRLLPYSVYADDTQEKNCPADVAEARDTLGTKVSVCVKGGPTQQSGFLLTESQLTLDPSSAILECKLCGANVGLWNFPKMVRPSPAICAIAKGQLESNIKEPETPPSCIPTLSGSDAWSGGNPNEISKDTHEVLKSPQPSPCLKGVLDLSLTIAGGPPPTQLIYPPSVLATYIPVPGIQLVGRHLESSQMGDWMTSQKSREPQDHGHDLTVGECSVSRQSSRLLQTDSVNGVVVDNDGDETDAGVSGKLASELWKHKLADDTSAVDQISPEIAVEDENYAIAGCYKDFDHQPRKRKKEDFVKQESSVQVTSFRETPVSSSVNATNIIHSKMTNSAESVEYLPESNDGLETGARRKTNQQSSRGASETQADSHTCKESVEVGLSIINSRNVDLNSKSDVKARAYKTENEEEADRTEVSYNRLPSIAAETERVEDFLDLQLRQNRSQINKLQLDTQGDSNEAFVSYSSDRGAFVEAVIVQREPEGQQPTKKQKKEQGVQNDIDSTVVGLLVGGKTATLDHTDAECPETSKSSPGLLAGYFPGASAIADQVEDNRYAWDTENGSFDPVMHHHYFCPWINLNASTTALCGWQLTLDAVDALRMNGQIYGEMMQSESTASKFKGNPLKSIRSLLRGSSFK